MSSGCLLGQCHKLTDKQKEATKKYLKHLEEEDKNKMETPKAEILHLNLDCQGSHYPPQEIEELQKRLKALIEASQHVLEFIDNDSSEEAKRVFAELEKALNETESL